MIPNDRDRTMARLLAIWPTPAMSDATRVVWNEFLAPLDADRSAKALAVLQRTSQRRPAQAAFWECYLAESGPTHALPRPPCGICEDGWVSVPCEDKTCTRLDHTVTPCPNGCKPPSREEIEQRLWAEARR